MNNNSPGRIQFNAQDDTLPTMNKMLEDYIVSRTGLRPLIVSMIDPVHMQIGFKVAIVKRFGNLRVDTDDFSYRLDTQHPDTVELMQLAYSIGNNVSSYIVSICANIEDGKSWDKIYSVFEPGIVDKKIFDKFVREIYEL